MKADDSIFVFKFPIPASFIFQDSKKLRKSWLCRIVSIVYFLENSFFLKLKFNYVKNRTFIVYFPDPKDHVPMDKVRNRIIQKNYLNRHRK